jgi:hypothetical protein
MNKEQTDEIFCENCGYPIEGDGIKEFEHRNRYGVSQIKFCFICYETFLGHATLYSSQVADTLLYKAIAQVTHIILDKIEEIEEKFNE